jgi:hypothetical protein
MSITIELDGVAYEAELYDSAAPQTCKVLTRLSPLKAKAYHAMWSGQVLIVDVPALAGLPFENKTTYLSRGSIIVHPEHKELCIACNETQFKEPTGPVYVTKVGQISNANGLTQICARAQRAGMRDILVRIPK